MPVRGSDERVPLEFYAILVITSLERGFRDPTSLVHEKSHAHANFRRNY